MSQEDLARIWDQGFRAGQGKSRLPGRLALPLSQRSDWPTPQALFDALDAEFAFTLDPCAASHNAKCSVYFTEEEDGLSQDWGQHSVFMNPPYGLALRKWMRKAYESSLAGATVVCLVPSRTDTRWWHEHAEKASERRFIRGRISFAACGGHSGQAPFPSAIIVFRPAIDLAVDPSWSTPESFASPLSQEEK